MSKCLKSGPSGSCTRDAVEGSLFCERHSNEVALQRAYVLEDAQLAQKFERQHGITMLQSLTEELALLRAMVNDRLDMAKTDAERMQAYNQVASWLSIIDKLQNSVNKMEERTSAVLSKETLMHIFREILDVLSQEIRKLPNSEEVIDAVAVRIVPVIEKAANVGRE